MAVLRSLAGPHRRLPSRLAASRSRRGSSGRSAEHRRQPGLPRRASPSSGGDRVRRSLHRRPIDALLQHALQSLRIQPRRASPLAPGSTTRRAAGNAAGGRPPLHRLFGRELQGQHAVRPAQPSPALRRCGLDPLRRQGDGLRAPSPQCAGRLCRAHQLFRLSRPLAADRLHRILPVLAPHAPAGSRAWHSVAGAGQRHVPSHRSAIPQGPCRHRTLLDRSARFWRSRRR